MDWTAALWALVLCVGAATLEVLSYSKSAMQWFRGLSQPRFDLPPGAWNAVGALYYLLFGVVAYIAISGDRGVIPITLIVLVMTANGLSNIILFRYRSLKWFHIFLYPFTALVAVLFALLVPVDTMAATLIGAYLAWLVYDIYYFRSLYAINSVGR